MALVFVFKNGVEHRIEGCNKISRPTRDCYGDIYINGYDSGTFLSKEDIAFYYFTNDKEKADE